jgi:hypothetical protein
LTTEKITIKCTILKKPDRCRTFCCHCGTATLISRSHRAPK